MRERVTLGIDVLAREGFSRFRNQRIGLIINPSSVDSTLSSTLDIFVKGKVKLTALFGPEHGIRGELQDQEVSPGFMDTRSGIPTYSLYGEHLAPDKPMLKNVDTLVFDIQDVGARYYTFIWTMELAMEKAAQYKKKFVVLDRPNPINGIDIEGPVLKKGYESFVGLFSIPIRHGMTVGELSHLFKKELKIGIDLEIVKMEGWKRDLWFDETGLWWVSPSPNMVTLSTAIVYPGMCLLEGTNVSEGRGTTKPFEYFGAPWLECERVMDFYKEQRGCRLRPLCFKPLWNKYKGEDCFGFQIHVTDRSVFKPVRTALEIIRAIRESHQDSFRWRDPPYEFEEKKVPFDILVGNSSIREKIDKGCSSSVLARSCRDGLKEFKRLSEEYFLYT
jgi:uncharacterized protein YbbC (DUF1343 family)